MWGVEWSKNYTYAPNEDDFNHIQNHSVSLTDNNSGVTFIIYGDNLSTYSTILNGLQIETSVQSLKWTVPVGYIITVTSVKAKAGSDRSSKLKLGNQTSASLFWTTKEVTCSGLSLGNNDTFTPIQAQSNRCFLYTLTISYTLKLDYTVLDNAISAANTAKSNLSNSTFKTYLQAAITSSTNSKTDGSLTSPASVTAKANWLKAITAYLKSLDAAWGLNKNNIPDAVYDMLHAYDSYGDPNSYSTSDINSATLALNKAIDIAGKTTSAYLTAKNTTLPGKQTLSTNNNPSGVADADITAAYTALESDTTVAMINATLATIKQFDSITFNDVSQIKVNKTATSVASAHNTVLYISNTPTVISVSSDGSTLTGVALGSAIITAYTSTGNGYYAIAGQKTFTVIRNENNLTILGNQTLKVDEAKGGVYDNKNSNAAIQYEITDVNYTNSSQNEGTGVISYDPATNTITAKNAGSATLRIYQAQNEVYEAVDKSLNVTVAKYDQTLSWVNNISELSLIVGETLNTSTAQSDSNLPVAYSSSNEEILFVDSSTGELTAVSEGPATITVRQAGNYKYNAATPITRDFTIIDKLQASFMPDWWDGDNQPLTTELKVGTSTTIELTNIATDATFTVSANPTGIISWTREGNTLTINGDVAGTTELTLSQTGNAFLNGNTATYTITVSRYPNTFAVAAETQAMKVGDIMSNVVTDNGNANTVVTYSTEGIATYDATTNSITAVGEGSTTITFTQAATATHAAATKSIDVTVTKVTNTLAITLPAQDVEVGGTIELGIDYKNNPSAITAIISDEQLSSSVNNGTHVITFDNNVITACNAGTAKIKFKQAATDTYAGFESATTYDITVSKISNTITVTLDNEVRSSKNVARGDNVVLKYSSVSNGAYTVMLTSGSTATATLGNNAVVDGVNTRNITAGSTDGTNIWTISQAETYKYEPATTTVRIKVNSIAEDPGYVYKHDEEIGWGTYGGTGALKLDGPGEFFTFDAKRTPILGVTDNLGYKAQYSPDGSNWTSFGLELANRDTWYPCSFPGNNQPIPENTTYVQILSEFPAGGNHQVRNILVTRKTFIKANDVNGTNLGETYVDATPYLTKKFRVSYSTTNGGDIEIISNNPRFEVSQSKIEVAYNSDNVGEGDTPVEITVTYKPDKSGCEFAGADAATITISDLFNSAELSFTATAKKRETTIARGSNTKTTTTVDGVLDNVFSFTGTSTVTPSANSSDNFYYVISHTPSAINNGNGVISYDPATNKITGLNGGTATLTIYQKNTAVYNATSQSFTFSVSKLENNVDISLSANTLAVDGTATVILSNADSDGALSATYSNISYLNESQNRDGGLLTFAGNTLTGWNAGTGTVTITQAETYKYVAKIQSFDVTVNKLPQTLTWNNPSLETTMQVGSTLEGNTATSDVGLTPVTYSSGNTAAITVDANTGVLTAVATGSNVGITASQAGNYKYLSATLTRQFSVFNKQTPAFAADSNFEGTNGRVEYTGTATITVTGVGTDSEQGFTITNGDNSVISVVRDGETITITGLQVGSTTLTLAQAGNDDFIAKSQTYNIEVYWPDDFLALSSTVEPTHTAGTYRKVFVNNTLKLGYSTIALPFNTTVETLTGRAANDNDWVAQLSVVTYNAKDGYSLYFKKSNTIEANQPYILHLGSAVDSPVFTNVSVVAAEEATKNATNGVYLTDWTMHSNYSHNFDMEGKYGVVNGEGILKKGTTGSTLKAFHAYMTGPAAAGVKAAYLDEDEADGILELLNAEATEPENIYDLQGRQLPRAGKGINIIRNADGTVRKVLTPNR